MLQNKNYSQERMLKPRTILTHLISRTKQQLLFKINESKDIQPNWKLLFQLLTWQSIKSSEVLNG